MEEIRKELIKFVNDNVDSEEKRKLLIKFCKEKIK